MRKKYFHLRQGLAASILACLLPATAPARGDSVVVFNEVMYHPGSGDLRGEWVELYNQLAVNVDLSGWSISGGIQYRFAEGTVIPGGGYLVLAQLPAELKAAAGVTNIWGPFTGRLANGGDTLRLRNNNDRLMDELAYGVEGDWPVGPDGAGVSLAKLDEEMASGPARSWTVSAAAGGTPGRRNFPLKTYETTTTTPVSLNSAWSYENTGLQPPSNWREPGFDDRAWATGQGLFQSGGATLPIGDPQRIPTVFSTGVGADGVALAPGNADPHYLLTQSAQPITPAPPVPATVIQGHPAWAAADAVSGWIGPVNPGTTSIAAGSYRYRTTFVLDGFDAATASLTINVWADNRLNSVLFNGVSKAFSYEGFASMSGDFILNSGFVAGTNTLEFLAYNDDSGANPGGFRARVTGTARQRMTVNTQLPGSQPTRYFRSRFVLNSQPQVAAVQLSAVIADGAVFYLNGTEVRRWNLPEGPVDAATPALSNVASATQVGPFLLPASALRLGTNVLAVEVHTAGATLDCLFGAAVSLTTTNILVPPPITLALNECASATNDDFWVELINYGKEALELEGCELSVAGGLPERRFVLPAQSLAPGALAQLSQTTLGFGAAPGDRVFLHRPGRVSLLDAVVAKRKLRGRWPDGTGAWWYPARPTPGASNAFEFQREVVFNEIMYHAPVPVPVATVAEAHETTLLPATARWRYNQTGSNLGNGWSAPAYDDHAWPEGAALLYVEDAALPEPKNTALALGPLTFYFRTSFVFDGNTNGLELRLRTVLDDGAVFYLNGAEACRVNMAEGAVDYSTLASTGVGDAVYLGPFTLPTTNLVRGTNLLAVEVHQASAASSDVVFGAELVASYSATTNAPVVQDAEAWVELFNRGALPVDLAGWQLAHDIDFPFPAGTVLPPGGFLVVARDPSLLQAKYPGLAVLGPLGGSLRHRGGHLQLLDASGNPANELRYYDAKPWPAYADGGGSSLELRDPWADNSRPEAWAASLNTSRSAWSNYTYRAVASNVLGPTQWKEFVIGLLEAGECLIDNLSVVENPTGTRVAMLQNGGFETGLTAWRALGNHSASRVEVDPDNPTNHVLHLVSTGATEHLHNHLETTLASGRSVVDGREYEVSFQAKWLAGNNRLNTRLYFNRVARTFSLALPGRYGTPGAANSTSSTNLGPTFLGLSHSPLVPKAGEPVTIKVSAWDPQGVAAVDLRWVVNRSAGGPLPMAAGAFSTAHPGYREYAATIPGQAAGTVVQFYVQATDSLGASAMCPAAGPQSRALFKVDEGKAVMPLVHRFRLLVTAADTSLLHARTNVMSNDRLGATVIYDDREAFYDAGIHLQSSERGRDQTTRVGFSVQFPADQLFRGAQNVLTFDRSGGYAGVGGRQGEILLWQAINHAGGIPGFQCDLAQVYAPRTQEDGPCLLRMSAYDADWLDSQYPNGAEGNIHTVELIYYPTTTLTGNAQAPKLPEPDEVINVEIQNWGNDPENYRWIFLQENHAEVDDYRPMIALAKAFSLTGTALETQTRQLMDLDEWMRTLAFKAFTGDGDNFTYGYTHNWKIYFRPGDGKAVGFPWDMDYAFAQGTDAAFPGSGSPNTYKIVKLPDNFRRYNHHLLDILTTTVNATYLKPWATHFAKLVGEDWTSEVNYLQQRATFIRNSLPSNAAFAITSNSGKDFATAKDQVTLTGTAPLTVGGITVNGLRAAVTWTSLTNWSLSVPLPGNVNLLTLQGLDARGNRLTNYLDTITVTNTVQPALLSVVFNEWMAANTGPGGVADPASGHYPDWFELYNPNPAPVNLAGYLLADSLSLAAPWVIPTNTVIGANGFLLVWADGATNFNTLANRRDLHAGFRLNKNGDALSLLAPNGAVQHSVAFGPQLPNISQGFYPDGNTNAILSLTNWTPGAANQLGLPPLQIGKANLDPAGGFSFEFSAIPGRAYIVEYKEALDAPAWTPLGGYHTAAGPTLAITDVVAGSTRRFYRVVLAP
jgi:hypothetical protein